MASHVWVPTVEAVIELGSSRLAHWLSAELPTIIADKNPDIDVLMVTRSRKTRTSALEFKSLGAVAPRGYPLATISMDSVERPRPPYLAEVKWWRHIYK